MIDLITALLVNMAASIFLSPRRVQNKIEQWRVSNPKMIDLLGFLLVALAMVLVLVSRYVSSLIPQFTPKIFNIPIPRIALQPHRQQQLNRPTQPFLLHAPFSCFAWCLAFLLKSCPPIPLGQRTTFCRVFI